MVLKLLNPNQSKDNILKATSNLNSKYSLDQVVLAPLGYMFVIPVANGVSNFSFQESRGEYVSVSFSPALSSVKEISEGIQNALTNNGYFIQYSEGSGDIGVTVKQVSNNYQITIKGDVTVGVIS